MVLGQPGGGAVVVNNAILAQHQAIAGLAYYEIGEGVDVDAVEEGPGVRAMYIDLAERRDVAETDTVPHRPHFACHRFQPVLFACYRIPLRAFPEASVDEDRAALG